MATRPGGSGGQPNHQRHSDAWEMGRWGPGGEWMSQGPGVSPGGFFFGGKIIHIITV